MTANTEYPLALKGLKILQEITQATAPISAKELSQITQISKPTMYRILTALEQQKYITKYRKKYQILNQATFDLSTSTLAHWHIQSTRSVLLTALSEKVNETCNLSVIVNKEIIYIDRVEANLPVKVKLDIAAKLPMHCTAAGKLFLAYTLPSKRKQIIQNLPLSKNSPKTITDPIKLFDDCKMTRRKGYAIADEELSIGSIAIACPIFSTRKNMTMAVSIQAPKFRKSIDELCSFLPKLQDTANKIQTLYQSIDIEKSK